MNMIISVRRAGRDGVAWELSGDGLEAPKAYMSIGHALEKAIDLGAERIRVHGLNGSYILQVCGRIHSVAPD